MTEARRQYLIQNLSLEELNFILNLIADRLDELEGRRGTPGFHSAPDMNANKITNVADGAASTDGVSLSQLSSTSVDHGSIGGLTDDDHPQYMRLAGTQTVTGDKNFTGALQKSGNTVWHSGILTEEKQENTVTALAAGTESEFTLTMQKGLSSKSLMINCRGGTNTSVSWIAISRTAADYYERQSGGVGTAPAAPATPGTQDTVNIRVRNNHGSAQNVYAIAMATGV